MTYDVIGIGIGPFNLGLAALLEERTELSAAFFDENTSFEWHPGMLLEGTDLQVPFLADLVTMANPQSRYTFLNYIHENGRMLPFYFFNRFDIPRREYNAYCQWVANQVGSCHFGRRVTNAIYVEEEGRYKLTVHYPDSSEGEIFYAKHLVVGTGNTPLVPPGVEEVVNDDVIHSSTYAFHQEEIKQANAVTVVGSGQSAAEIFYTLLTDQPEHGYKLSWFTRSPGFFQLEESKLGQEVFSPEYVDYFHKLPYDTRQDALPLLGSLRNGVQQKTLHKIYDRLYHQTVHQTKAAVRIQALVEVNGVKKAGEGTYELDCWQWQEERAFVHKSEKVIFSTGYKPNVPKWLQAMESELVMESEKEFAVNRNAALVFKKKRAGQVYSLTNLDHSHGTSATNLALSVQRNMRIVNELAGENVYETKKSGVFQQFSAE
ncbi:lysine N(6)-hydroxylase/L-ornithine N(5)-oxygenase family protein [Shouchella shacheensis]|uniref:lysine N(6)-hydroxylase/L-ornithine N(5)-oxygenase family protein n=1 Tax=Shouchella shacheensis TaxID=1649580 RepID=UPI00073FC8B8|nr:SidA/IucD/PvdA family monooxygenase [Shouchella shacheensis]